MPYVVYLPEARDDLFRIWQFIATGSGSPDIADSFIDPVDDTCGICASHPKMGQMHPELGSGVRSFPVGKYVGHLRVPDPRTLAVSCRGGGSVATRRGERWGGCHLGRGRPGRVEGRRSDRRGIGWLGTLPPGSVVRGPPILPQRTSAARRFLRVLCGGLRRGSIVCLRLGRLPAGR